MRCPSCGAISKKRSMKCAECGAFRNRTWVDTDSTQSLQADRTVKKATAPTPKKQHDLKSTPSLLEFPSPTRNAIPQWRKELGERVREVQERRAREASLDGGDAASLSSDAPSIVSRPLELLSGGPIQPTNPLVVAALRRIERAHAQSQFSVNAAVATMADYEEQLAFDQCLRPAYEGSIGESDQESDSIQASVENPIPQAEKTRRLSVVSAPTISSSEPPFGSRETPATLEAESKTPLKPKRLIRDNDPALDYLDSVPTSVKVDLGQTRSASVFLRMSSAIIDFVVVCLLSAPVVALVKLTELQWQDPRVITFAAGTLVIATFLYLTISTAMTGRTFAMRLCSLRVVDARTGLIPTGAQSMGRTLIYMLSLATAGLGLALLFVDREGRTAHDRFTRTAVVRV